MPSYPGGVGLCIGIPYTRKGTTVEWAFGLMNLHAPTNYDIRWATIKEKPVDVARTMIAEAAMQQKAKYLFFLGTDVTVPPYTVRQLIFHLEHFPKFAVGGAVYVHKSRPQEPLVYRGNGQGPYWDWKVGEVFDVSGLGMDATLIRMSVFEDMPKPWFKTVDTVEAYKDGIHHAEHWTEDLWFCKNVSEICAKCNKHKLHHDKADHEFWGWQLLVDGGLLCQHWDNENGIAYELPFNSKPYQKMFKRGPKRIVDLGCGTPDESYHTNEGETLRVDVREDVKPDYRCDIRSTPFQNGWFDVVFSSHTLEHFPRNEVGAVLDEMIRIMKPDGELRLVLPNLEWAARHVINGEIDNDVYNVLYGAQSYEENFHKVGFTPKTLETALRSKGFKRFQFDFDNYHMLCRAWKSETPNVEELQQIVGFKHVETKSPLDKSFTLEALPVPEMKANDFAGFVAEQNKGSVEIQSKEEVERAEGREGNITNEQAAASESAMVPEQVNTSECVA